MCSDVVVVNRPSPSFRAQDLDEIDSDSSAVRESLYHDIFLRLSKPEDITIYGYPLDVFPSTDFHKATYFQGSTSSRAGQTSIVLTSLNPVSRN